MADISKVTIDGITYNLKDVVGRNGYKIGQVTSSTRLDVPTYVQYVNDSSSPFFFVCSESYTFGSTVEVYRYGESTRLTYFTSVYKYANTTYNSNWDSYRFTTKTVSANLYVGRLDDGTLEFCPVDGKFPLKIAELFQQAKTFLTDVKDSAGTSLVSSGVATLPAIPSKTSDLTNDSGYLTLATLPIYDGSVT